MKDGCQCSNCWVHCIKIVNSVGLRHDNKPCILKIDANRACEDRILFYFKSVYGILVRLYENKENEIGEIYGTKSTIHFVYNKITGAFDDFKFKFK